jgi:hypothetical protein
MRGSEIRVYADPADMKQLLNLFDQIGGLAFTEALSRLNAPPARFTDPRDLINYLRNTMLGHGGIFLVTRAGDAIVQMVLTMQDGSGTKVSTHQPFNPHAIMINLGGELEGDRTVVATSVNTTGETPKAKELFKAFKKLVLRNAEYINGFYVMPRALEKLDSGWRLTPEPQHSRSLDLKRPE